MEFVILWSTEIAFFIRKQFHPAYLFCPPTQLSFPAIRKSHVRLYIQSSLILCPWKKIHYKGILHLFFGAFLQKKNELYFSNVCFFYWISSVNTLNCAYILLSVGLSVFMTSCFLHELCDRAFYSKLGLFCLYSRIVLIIGGCDSVVSIWSLPQLLKCFKNLISFLKNTNNQHPTIYHHPSSSHQNTIPSHFTRQCVERGNKTLRKPAGLMRKGNEK